MSDLEDITNGAKLMTEEIKRLKDKIQPDVRRAITNIIHQMSKFGPIQQANEAKYFDSVLKPIEEESGIQFERIRKLYITPYLK